MTLALSSGEIEMTVKWTEGRENNNKWANVTLTFRCTRPISSTNGIRSGTKTVLHLKGKCRANKRKYYSLRCGKLKHIKMIAYFCFSCVTCSHSLSTSVCYTHFAWDSHRTNIFIAVNPKRNENTLLCLRFNYAHKLSLRNYIGQNAYNWSYFGKTQSEKRRYPICTMTQHEATTQSTSLYANEARSYFPFGVFLCVCVCNSYTQGKRKKMTRDC